MTAHEGTTPPTAGAAGEDHPTAWHTLAACFLGYMLNAMDVQIIGPALREITFVSPTGVVLMGTATLLTSALGGWLAGGLADRFGRVGTLQIMIAVLAASTLLCAMAPFFTPERNYTWLFVMRAVVGIGFGGQWAAAAVMVGEAWAFSKDHRGKAVGFMHSGWAFGWGFAELLPLGLHYILPGVPVWRVLFLVGGLLPVLLILYVRRYVRESPVFEITRDRRAAANRTADLLEIFSPARLPLRGAENLALSAIDRHHRNRRTIIGTTVRCCMLSIGALCGYYAILVWLPAFLTAGKLKVDGQYLAFLIIGSGAGYLVSAFFSDLDRLGWRGNFGLFAFLAMVLALPAFLVDSGLIVTWSYLLFVIIGSGVGYLVSALLSPLLGDRDLFGRRRNFVLFAIFAIAALFACTHFGDKDIIPKLDVRQSVIRGLAFPLGFFISGTFAGTGAFLTELFPTRMRGSGVGFTYNFGRGFVVLMLWLIPWVAVTDDGLGPSIGAFVLVAYGLVIIAALLIRETKGIALDTDVEEAQETVPAASTAAAP